MRNDITAIFKCARVARPREIGQPGLNDNPRVLENAIFTFIQFNVNLRRARGARGKIQGAMRSPHLPGSIPPRFRPKKILRNISLSVRTFSIFP